MTNFVGRDILSMEEFSRADIMQVMRVAEWMETHEAPELLKGVLMASLFFEPSTRTRLSFETAAHRLGANVITATGVKFSSLYKGETLQDTASVIGGYADVMVMRHPEQGSARALADGTDKPVINAGDGPGDHPTQTLLDLYTIMSEKGTLDNLKIGFVGDLKYGRTVHSLVTALRFFNPELYFVSPPSLAMPDEYKQKLDHAAVTWHESTELDDALANGDILYVTRVQKERFDDEAEYERLKLAYVIDQSTLDKAANKEIRIMHPLPRVGEIKEEIDDSPNAIYFQQAWNGVTVRKALLALVSGRWQTERETTSRKLTKRNVLLSIGGEDTKRAMAEDVRRLAELGCNLYATENTARFLSSQGIATTLLHKISEPENQPNIKTFLEQQRFDIVINIPTGSGGAEATDGSMIRKLAIEHDVALITDPQVARFLIAGLA